MTERRRWPNAAETARVEAIALAMRGLRILEPVLEAERCTETLRSTAQAMSAFHQIIAELGAVGPQLTPGTWGKQNSPAPTGEKGKK